jgi:hypothetical protein
MSAMKTLVATVAAVLLACSDPATGAQVQKSSSTDALRGIVKTYLELHALLAQDKFDELKGPAGTLASQAAALGKEGAGLAKAATAFAAAKDLKLARDSFAPLSDALIARVKANGSADLASDLRVGYCPMNRQSWIQREEPVRNPYYGTTMLTCGSVSAVNAPPKK